MSPALFSDVSEVAPRTTPPSPFSLANKTIAITGAGRGLGITLAQAVVEGGGCVACLDILPEPAADQWAELQKVAKAAGVTATYDRCDVTVETEVQGLLERIADEGAARGADLAGVVACAGIQQKLSALEYPAADFERILRVNSVGVFTTAKYAAKAMIDRKLKGSIVLIASMSGQIANRGLRCSAYNSSKAAVQQLGRSLAQEWGEHDIRVNTLSPGTAMTDALLEAEPELERLWMAGALLGRLGTPEDFKAPTVFLLAEGSSFMTGADLRTEVSSPSLIENVGFFEIIDVTESIVREYRGESSVLEHDGVHHISVFSSKPTPDPTQHRLQIRNEKLPEPSSRQAASRDSLCGPEVFAADPVSLLPSQFSKANGPLSPQTEQTANDLLSLGQPAPHFQVPSVDERIPGAFDDTLSCHDANDAAFPRYEFDDGLFITGSAYLDLHSTLRSSLFQESRSNAPTRCGTPQARDTSPDAAHCPLTVEPVILTGESARHDADLSVVLTAEQERVLWVNWLDELDKFDCRRHFQNTLSAMAMQYPYVKYAILALSARQLERKGSAPCPIPSSLAFYQQAIHSLLPEIGTRSTPVIASCVVLCVLEMLSCSPKAWHRHLDGCATLLQAVGIHGFSGDFEEALFWCFARMDVCGGLISSSGTLIPPSVWTPADKLHEAVQLFRNSPKASFDAYANQAVFLIAHVVNLIATNTPNEMGAVFVPPPSRGSRFDAKWKKLWGFIDNWYVTRPVEMHPVFTASCSPPSSFPTILFSNPAAISGNQMYHASALLMLQHQPPHITLPNHRSIFWHARRIVGISKSNDHHGCWINALQPLWLAGRCFSSPSEQEEILALFGTIERESGWASSWRADDLRQCFGYDQGVISGLLTGVAFTRTFPEIDTGDGGSSSLQGTVVAIYEIGCFFGAIGTMLFGERLGRKKTIMLGCVILCIGGALQASSSTIPHMIVGRIVAGLGNGLNTSTIPVWHSELMRPTERGKGLSIELAITIFGVMTAYWVDYGMSFIDNDAQFRFPLALQCVFAIITLLALFFLPESPRWLVAHDRHDEARQVLWSVENDARHIDASDDRISHNLSEIQQAIREERDASQGSTYRAMIKNGEQRYLHRILLGIGGQFMQQLSGINLITYYAPVIFQQSVGISHDLSLLLAGFNGIAYFLSSLIPIWTIDRLGRRKLMLFAAAGQCASMAILAGTVANGSKPAGIAAIVMLFLFNFFFAVGMLAIPWLLPAEYSPLAIRTRSAALATASNWIFTFLVVEITPISITNIGWRTYVYFSVFNLCFLPLIYFFYPETRNLSLEQIDKLFTGGKVLLHWHPSMGEGEADTLSAGSLDEKAGNVETVELRH
ncbi:hypothetical protein G7Z17_g3022 [Cylindrodendrum hubeiense]|uniref:Major facilitator superfamily (MFS) profile domain-containing protein n=1 Tax=Cylindrodendrum hubeiense TaxID=595255 RepID=A0A9P5LJR5_9HYPO|nr:hypothetical protein G7Z17_g3022 [Cylindrodendrum hubeiense]